MDSRAAVIGDSESIKGFAAVGLDIFPCDDAHTASSVFRHIADGGEYAVIFLTEEIFEALSKERSRIENNLTPAVIPIPGVKGNSGVGIRRLSSFVEKAVGSDIIFND